MMARYKKQKAKDKLQFQRDIDDLMLLIGVIVVAVLAWWLA